MKTETQHITHDVPEKTRTAHHVISMDPRRANVFAPAPSEYAAVREADDVDVSMSVGNGMPPAGVLMFARAAAWGAPAAHRWGRDLMVDELYKVERQSVSARRLPPVEEPTVYRMAVWLVSQNGLTLPGMSGQDVVQSACAVLVAMGQPLSLDSVLLIAQVLVHDELVCLEEEDLLDWMDVAAESQSVPVEWLD